MSKIHPIKSLFYILILLCIAVGCPPFLHATGSSAITITDAAGLTHAFDKPPKRIVIVGNAPYMPLHLLYMFPQTKDVLVGYERKFKTAEEFLPLIDPELDKKTVLAANPGTEQIASLHPDVVITKGSVIGPLDNSLSTLNIPLVHLGFESPEMFLKDVKTVGMLLGSETRAKKILDFYADRLNLINSGLKTVTQEEKPSILLLEYSNRGGEVAVRVPAKTWIQTLQTQIAGGRPVWTKHLKAQEGWQVVGFEQIAAWNPDQIFMVVWFRLNGLDVLHSLQKDSKWQRLKAVVANELYLFPEDVFGWDSADPRWILGVMWLATKIHPERFAAINMEREVRCFFETLYGMKPTTIQSELMPRIHINGK